MYGKQCAAWAAEIEEIAEFLEAVGLTRNVKRRISDMCTRRELSEREGLMCTALGHMKEAGDFSDLYEAISKALGKLGGARRGNASPDDLRAAARHMRKCAGINGVKSAAKTKQKQPSLEARALAMLTDHPEWSDTKIAGELQCSRTSLYRFSKFTAARELLSNGKAKFNRNT